MGPRTMEEGDWITEVKVDSGLVWECILDRMGCTPASQNLGRGFQNWLCPGQAFSTMFSSGKTEAPRRRHPSIRMQNRRASP